ncbi:GL25413 [Drosophila persimilis]|uniref:GL25413 n=1 Tax=Drosophila persimilis TaxID=7234 RepID=B4H8Q6_DROPE|nr:uncharacterized protein LOC6602159 [Drosophila persimilis]EDW35099.1 GL25413 [Drosophila persimilis]
MALFLASHAVFSSAVAPRIFGRPKGCAPSWTVAAIGCPAVSLSRQCGGQSTAAGTSDRRRNQTLGFSIETQDLCTQSFATRLIRLSDCAPPDGDLSKHYRGVFETD